MVLRCTRGKDSTQESGGNKDVVDPRYNSCAAGVRRDQETVGEKLPGGTCFTDRLCREAINDVNAHVHVTLAAKANRFRKVAESVVQANRLAVEKAKEENDANPTEKRRQYNSSLQRWQADFNDTATWLYHLVFMTGIDEAGLPPPAPPHTNLEARSSTGSHQPTVEDYNSEGSNKGTTTRLEKTDKMVKFAPSPTQTIVWNQLTEPSIVVDRLLHTWTFLSDSQVRMSAESSPFAFEGAWAQNLVQRIEKYNEERDKKKRKTLRDLVELSSSEDDGELDDEQDDSEAETWDFITDSSHYRSFRHQKQPSNPVKVGDTGYSSSGRQQEHKPPQLTPLDSFSVHTVDTDGNTLLSRNEAKANKASRPGRTSWPLKPSYHRNPFHPQSRPQVDNLGNTYIEPTSFSTPFPVNEWTSIPNEAPNLDPRVEPPERFYTPPPTRSPPPERPPPPPPPPPPPLPPLEQAKLLRLVDLLERGLEAAEEGPEKRMSRLDDVGVVHKIEEKVLNRDWGERMEENLSRTSRPFANDDTDERIAKIEDLLREQHETIRGHSEIEEQWRKEKVALEAKAAEAANEAERLRKKSIAEAKAAKKAAQKSLKFVEKTIAETNMEIERNKIERDYTSRLEAYERRLAALSGVEQRESSPPTLTTGVPMPSRRTFIEKGECRIEVSEFFDGKASSNPVQFAFENILHSDSLRSKDSPRNLWSTRSGSISHTPHSEMVESKLLGPPSSHGNDESDMVQSVVTLPSIDSPSARTRELHANLKAGGFLTRSSIPFPNSMEIVPYVEETSIVGRVPSTICWEPPTGPLGSDLIRTLRSVGWRPFYVRISGRSSFLTDDAVLYNNGWLISFSTDAGHTYFIGNQPVHVHFFTPDYRPQFTPSEGRNGDYLLISKDLVEEYALLELGFQFKMSSTGAYALDGRLTTVRFCTKGGLLC